MEFTIPQTNEEWSIEKDINDYSVNAGNARVAGYIIAKRTALLIAAAPELFEALKALHKNVDKDLSGYWTESTSNFMQMAEAAIAKAEGR